MFDSMFPSHWTTLRKLMWLKLKGASAVWATVTGNPVTFQTVRSAPLKQLSVAFSPVQSGSGDPSPDNVRPISGWSSLTVYHSGADTSNPQTISISLGETVYSGTLDVLTGVLTVDWAAINMGTLNWNAHATISGVFQTTRGANPAWERIAAAGVGQAICSRFILVTSASGGVDAIDGSIALGTGSSNNIYAHDSTCADVTEFITAVTGQILCYKLATPKTIQLTPQQVSSLLGENNMWSDANGNLTVEYRSN